MTSEYGKNVVIYIHYAVQDWTHYNHVDMRSVCIDCFSSSQSNCFHR